jgi:hypothetical protein
MRDEQDDETRDPGRVGSGRDGETQAPTEVGASECSWCSDRGCPQCTDDMAEVD